MKNFKKYPRKQLEKFSTVFMQLGLVLTLFVVYVVIEHQTKLETPILAKFKEIEKPYEIDVDRPIIYKKVEIKKPEVKFPEPKGFNNLTNIDKVDNLDIIKKTLIDKPKDVKPQIFNIDKIKVVDEGGEIDANDDPVPFLIIEDAPIYRGCEGLSKEDNRKCFLTKIAKHVQRNFNAELAQDLNLRSGKHKMHVQFIIDHKGDVRDIQVSAAYKGLQKEAQRVIEKVPQFTPGMQRKKPVKVKYTLPITFYVE